MRDVWHARCRSCGPPPRVGSDPPLACRYAAALATVLPGPFLQGATWAGSRFVSNWSDYVTAFAPSLASLSYHRYPESACSNRTVTLAQLMDDAAAAGVGEFLAPLARVASAAGIPMYVGEGNSASCGGYSTVSDVLGAALWAVDVLFHVAAVGVERWNFHGGPKGPYAAIAYSDVSTDVPDVRPLYYGLLTFASATANDSVIYAVKNVTGNNPLIKAWAVKVSGRVGRGEHGHARVSSGPTPGIHPPRPRTLALCRTGRASPAWSSSTRTTAAARTTPQSRSSRRGGSTRQRV